MGSLRLIGRGLSDTLEHLLPFTLLTLGWWLSFILAVPAWRVAWWLGLLFAFPAPATTVALFAMADPRRATAQPELRESVAIARRSLRRGWGLALVIVPLVFVLVQNVAYYAGHRSRFAVLIPLWIMLLALALAIGLMAVSVLALTDAPVVMALKRAALLTAARPLRALLMVVALWLLAAAGLALVVPAVMFVPAMIAAIVNRFVLAGLGIPVVDPLAPTEERLHEEQAGKGVDGRRARRRVARR